jgi:hypothetical protein
MFYRKKIWSINNKIKNKNILNQKNIKIKKNKMILILKTKTKYKYQTNAYRAFITTRAIFISDSTITYF